MTEQDEAVTILIAHTGTGSYAAAVAGLDGWVHGETMAEALAAAVDRRGPLPESLQIKVREGTLVTAQDLIALLGSVGVARRLDLSGCGLEGIDLSPEALDRMACPDTVRVEVTRGIDLWGAQFQGAFLLGAQLQGAVLVGAKLQGTNLQRAQLQGAPLMSAQLQGADLWAAQLQGANLRGADLQSAHLQDAQLQGADLRDAQLQGANLHGAHLQGADLRRADLRELDLREVALDQVRWHNARLEKTWLYRHRIEPIADDIDALTNKEPDRYREAMEVYLGLKTNFLSLGNYEDAAWAYVKEQQMEKMAHYWEWRSAGWALWTKWPPFLRWLRNWAYELLTGYGERPQNPVIGGALVMLAFALGYWLTGAVAGLVDALVYSVATFATFNLGRPGLNPQGRGVELASSIEALLGISVLALVVYTLGNRMSRS